MSINQVAIIVNEDEQVIRELAHKMHIWVAATKKNKCVVESLWDTSIPSMLSATHYDVPQGATPEEMCVLAIDLIENHHSSIFGAAPWLEIHVYGCELTDKLKSEFGELANAKIATQKYGFSVKRPNE
ncbi:MAG: hypothetical protein P8045_17120 [Candidatus Thiodiazotropha sp.]